MCDADGAPRRGGGIPRGSTGDDVPRFTRRFHLAAHARAALHRERGRQEGPGHARARVRRHRQDDDVVRVRETAARG